MLLSDTRGTAVYLLRDYCFTQQERLLKASLILILTHVDARGAPPPSYVGESGLIRRFMVCRYVHAPWRQVASHIEGCQNCTFQLQPLPHGNEEQQAYSSQAAIVPPTTKDVARSSQGDLRHVRLTGRVTISNATNKSHISQYISPINNIIGKEESRQDFKILIRCVYSKASRYC